MLTAEGPHMKEWVLQGDSVLYTAAGIIRETPDYDF